MISQITPKHAAVDNQPSTISFAGDKYGPSSNRVAVVHDWLDSYSGAETVLERLLQVYNQADVFALVDFLPEKDRHILQGCDVFTSFIQRLPFAKRKFRGYLPLMPLAIEQFDFSPYDVVVSTSHTVAKGILTREDQLHVSYMHTPPRYAWDLYHDTLRINRLNWGIKGTLTRLMLHYHRLWDFATASRVDAFVANSHYIARRIWKTYRRKARVIYPPVSIDRFVVQPQKEDFYVTLSRLVPYKRVDLIAEAFSRMPSKRLFVIGDGPERAKLEKVAAPNVTYLGRIPEEQVNQYLQNARAFVFAANEDFGISPIEAQACGTPVIAYGHGGATETVVEGQTGLFFPQQTAASIVTAVEAFEACEGQFDPLAIRAHAEQFAPERFQRQFDALVNRRLNKRRKRQAMRLQSTYSRAKSIC
jgi:glycosyltransferase involved in cell wall biosynthesis